MKLKVEKRFSGKIYEVKGDGFNEETDMFGMKVTYLEPENMPDTSEKALYVWGIEAPEICAIYGTILIISIRQKYL